MKREDILKMGLEEIRAINTPDLIGKLQDAYRDEDVMKHVQSIVDPLARPYVDAVKRGYEQRRPKEEFLQLIEQFEAEPPLVRIRTWSLLTTNGVEQIELARYSFGLLADAVLAIFKVKLTPEQVESQQKVFDRYTTTK